MLKYKVISKNGTCFTWNVHIFMKPHATVGDFVREIKEAPSPDNTPVEKTVIIYRKGIAVGGAVFRGNEPLVWNGPASEIWGAPVERCELTAQGVDYIYKIWIKEPREGAYVRVHPILPMLFDAIAAPIPSYQVGVK